jgi:ferredoxin
MKLFIDPWRCQGHQMCIAVAPDLICYDNELSHAVPLNPDLDASSVALARQAAAVCPEQAITVSEDAGS